MFFVAASRANSETDSTKANALYVVPITALIYSTVNDMFVASIAYERQLSTSGWGLLVPFHAGYKEERDRNVFSGSYQTQTQFVVGAGVGLRKFLWHPFSGGYLTLQSDYAWLHRTDVDGNFSSITQIDYGYKMVSGHIVLDANIGAGFYIIGHEKRTYPSGAINFGFPFDANTFRLKKENQ